MGRKKNWWVKTDNQWGAPNWLILVSLLFMLIGICSWLVFIVLEIKQRLY